VALGGMVVDSPSLRSQPPLAREGPILWAVQSILDVIDARAIVVEATCPALVRQRP
jgi:hypothetical protein